MIMVMDLNNKMLMNFSNYYYKKLMIYLNSMKIIVLLRDFSESNLKLFGKIMKLNNLHLVIRKVIIN